MGACDVCPFVPVANITMDECVELAKKLGKRVGEELGISVYLYEYAASKPERKNLANCRKVTLYYTYHNRVSTRVWQPN